MEEAVPQPQVCSKPMLLLDRGSNNQERRGNERKVLKRRGYVGVAGGAVRLDNDFRTKAIITSGVKRRIAPIGDVAWPCCKGASSPRCSAMLRSTRKMSRFKVIGVFLVVLFALSAVAASAAQAENAPFYSIEGKRLGEGESHHISAKAANSKGLKLVTAEAGIVITCLKTEIEGSTGTIIGSKETEPGTSKEVVVFKECSVTGNGSPCKVEKETIKTNPLKDEQVEDSTGKKLDTLFEPSSGTEFTKVHFEGTCTNKETAVSGQTVAEDVTDPGEEVVELGQTAKEALSWDLRFPETRIKEVTKYKAGTGTKTKVKELVAFSDASIEEGVALVLLANSEGKTEEKKWSPLP